MLSLFTIPSLSSLKCCSSLSLSLAHTHKNLSLTQTDTHTLKAKNENEAGREIILPSYKLQREINIQKVKVSVKCM